MRTFIFPLVVAVLASPAWATITISVTDLGNGKAAIDYSGTERARAFALDITVDVGTIEGISDFAVGDDNNGYGIFPANFGRYITVDPMTGDVTDWAQAGYTPVADPNDPGALGGLGTNGITIEMASLYDTKAPPLHGRLCVITLSQSAKVSVATNATRGNVVLEDASQATVDLAGAMSISVGNTGGIAYSGPQREQWMAVGQPSCWISSLNPRQCRGDADGASQGKQQFWVSTNDLDILIASWNKPFEQLQGKKVGEVPLICADFDHLPQGKGQYRVSTNDLDILIANWQLANQPVGGCP